MAFPFPATDFVSFQEHREVDIMLSVTRRGPLDEACWELLREIDDVSVPDEDDVIVLIWASSDNVLEVIRVLLNHNVVNVNVGFNVAEPALIWASRDGDLDVVRE